MYKQTLSEWKAEMRKQYNAIRVVPANSFEAWGCGAVGRKLLATIKSPFGGRYKIFSDKTAAQQPD
jgi:hypothetical protein